MHAHRVHRRSLARQRPLPRTPLEAAREVAHATVPTAPASIALPATTTATRQATVGAATTTTSSRHWFLDNDSGPLTTWESIVLLFSASIVEPITQTIDALVGSEL